MRRSPTLAGDILAAVFTLLAILCMAGAAGMLDSIFSR